MSMETLSEALNRLALSGYRASFAANRKGVRCPAGDGWHDADDVSIDQIVRFEGDSDPADEAALFALTCRRCGAKGTYLAAYGPEMSSEDAEFVKRLEDRRGR